MDMPMALGRKGYPTPGQIEFALQIVESVIDRRT
jgi:hypothetical protein